MQANRAAQWRIYRTSALFFLVSVFAIACFGVILTAPPRTGGSYVPPLFAKYGAGETGYRLFELSFALLQASIASYIVPTVHAVVRKAASTQTVSSEARVEPSLAPAASQHVHDSSARATEDAAHRSVRSDLANPA